MGSWTEQGPTMTTRRSSLPERMSWMARRAWVTVRLAASTRGNARITSAGVLISLISRMRRSSVSFGMGPLLGSSAGGNKKAASRSGGSREFAVSGLLDRTRPCLRQCVRIAKPEAEIGGGCADHGALISEIAALVTRVVADNAPQANSPSAERGGPDRRSERGVFSSAVYGPPPTRLRRATFPFQGEEDPAPLGPIARGVIYV